MVVVVRQGPVDVGQGQVVPVRDRLRLQPAPFDALGDLPDRDTVSLKVGFIMDIRLLGAHDPVNLLGHRHPS